MATAAVRVGAPPRETSGVRGLWDWVKARRPQGKPPKGARSRSASWATQTPPVNSQGAGRRQARVVAGATRARMAASARARTIQASAPTKETKRSRGRKKASPNRAPRV